VAPSQHLADRGLRIEGSFRSFRTRVLGQRLTKDYKSCLGIILDGVKKDEIALAEAAVFAWVNKRFGSLEEMQAWYVDEAPPWFSGKTARDLVQAGRAQDIIDYIGAIDAGAYA
jgi:hypothetical protein